MARLPSSKQSNRNKSQERQRRRRTHHKNHKDLLRVVEPYPPPAQLRAVELLQRRVGLLAAMEGEVAAALELARVLVRHPAHAADRRDGLEEFADVAVRRLVSNISNK